MKLLRNILTYVEQRGIYDRFFNNSDIDKTDVAVLLVSVLHLEGTINDARLQAMYASLRKGTFLRGLNTYHCKINNKWYNDTDMFTVLMEVYQETTKGTEITLEVFLKYLNRYHNKNRNFCLDVIYFNYLQPLIENIERYPNYSILAGFELLDGEALTFEQADEKFNLGSGHCCEDCDGDFEDYRRSRYEYYYKKDLDKRAKEKCKTFLYNLKTHHKNPNDRLKC